MPFSRRTLLTGAASVAAGAAILQGPAIAASPPTARSAKPESGMLDVPGARLYYEVRGRGPTLLMIHPGSGEAGSFAPIAPYLARHFRVVSYDRRNSARSTLTRPAGQIPVAVHSDDARRLLAEVGVGGATVFGSSAGAIVAVDLATRFPFAVHTAIPHEPPLFELLPDRARYRALAKRAYEIYLSDGAEAGMTAFFGNLPSEPHDPDAEPDPPYTPDPEMVERDKYNDARFLAHELRPVAFYRPDLATLRHGPVRVIPAFGGAGDQQLYDITNTLARRICTPTVEVPGSHIGYLTRPSEFATRLLEVLS